MGEFSLSKTSNVIYINVVGHYFWTDSLMYWDEKIDNLKKETDPDDFKVPFTDWSTILKKIEDKFIVKENSNYIFSNWADRLRDKQKIKEFKTVDLETEITKLTPDQNYWIVLTGDNSATKNLVYDSKPSVILKLLQLRDGDFYIGDKKYGWLAYFKYNQTDLEVFKSGDQQTPWDKNSDPQQGYKTYAVS